MRAVLTEIQLSAIPTSSREVKDRHGFTGTMSFKTATNKRMLEHTTVFSTASAMPRTPTMVDTMEERTLTQTTLAKKRWRARLPLERSACCPHAGGMDLQFEAEGVTRG